MPPPDIKPINHEISWLEFNRRVLAEAQDPRTPLLERVKFASIFWSNLDEFFMKRVGGLKRQVMAEVVPFNEISPASQLLEIRARVLGLLTQHSESQKQIISSLKENSIQCLGWNELAPEEKQIAEKFFFQSVFPVLTPLSVDPGHPFPFISNLSTSFGVILRHPERQTEELFARVKIPSVFPPWLQVNPGIAKGARFVSLHDIVGHNLGSLFPGMEISDVMMFRVTRNADVDRDEEDAEDLLEMVAEGLRERRFAEVVRLDHGPNPSQRILKILKEELEVEDKDIYELPLPIENYSLQPISELNCPELKYTTWVPAIPSLLADRDTNFFDIVRETDVLVHHPFESFNATVERFIRTAAEDPKVIAIKMTLYRTGDASPFIPLLIRAAEAGKQVVCLVELKARFDEARNILVAQELEKAGVHVVYGIVGLKTHSKVALVVRQEQNGVRCYCHVGTGNYHSKTAQLYTDLGYFTAKREFTEDVVQLFHYLTGRSLHWKFKKLLVAPIDMKATFLRMIAREVDHQKKNKNGHIVAKMNALEDREIMHALYEASQAGVRIDLIVRGVCCLRPQVPGLSENIKVISVIGRFLEHSRMFYFRNGAETDGGGDFFIGSADWMSRNLNSRVEAVVPIEAPQLKQKCWDILSILWNDQRQAWELGADGSYTRRGVGKENKGAHEILMKIIPSVPDKGGRRVRRARKPGSELSLN